MQNKNPQVMTYRIIPWSTGECHVDVFKNNYPLAHAEVESYQAAEEWCHDFMIRYQSGEFQYNEQETLERNDDEGNMEIFTDTDKKEILLSLVYEEFFSHGTSNHNGYMALAKTAKQSGYTIGWKFDEDGLPTPVLGKTIQDNDSAFVYEVE